MNRNRVTGIISNRIIRFRIGSSGEQIDIRKEKIKTILLRQAAGELGFLGDSAPRTLFDMTNGDVLTGSAAEDKITITTDYGVVTVSFSEIRLIEMQGGDNVTTTITKNNKDTIRGTVQTEELTLHLDIGSRVAQVFKDKFKSILVDFAPDELVSRFDDVRPMGAESDVAALRSRMGQPRLAVGDEFVYVYVDLSSPLDNRRYSGRVHKKVTRQELLHLLCKFLYE